MILTPSARTAIKRLPEFGVIANCLPEPESTRKSWDVPDGTVTPSEAIVPPTPAVAVIFQVPIKKLTAMLWSAITGAKVYELPDATGELSTVTADT